MNTDDEIQHDDRMAIAGNTYASFINQKLFHTNKFRFFLIIQGSSLCSSQIDLFEIKNDIDIDALIKHIDFKGPTSLSFPTPSPIVLYGILSSYVLY